MYDDCRIFKDEIANLDKVWVELSAFPADIEQLKPGQPVTVYDLKNVSVIFINQYPQ